MIALDRAVASSGLTPSLELAPGVKVGAMVGQVKVTEGGARAETVDEVDRGDEELADGLDGAACGRGVAGGLADVTLADAVLPFELVGRLRDARVVVAMVDAARVATRDGADVLQEAAAPRALPSSRRGCDRPVDEALERELHALAVLRGLLGPQDRAHLAEEVDVLAELVSELVAPLSGLQFGGEPAEEGRWAP